MKRKLLKIETVNEVFAKATQIAYFICPSKKDADVENLRDKIYIVMILK